MDKKRLSKLTYGQFQKMLVRHTLKQLEDYHTVSPLIFFPIIHDRVESFLLAHWKATWHDCSDMNWNEWLHSDCYALFEEEVLDDIKNEALSYDISALNAVTKGERISY
ncbi:hypothetical protein LGQ02_06010 [Bacillus shivajii]|uniref:hypothetical protein n=1 Tax=Bacillus shivajii TaxID=1983719 RepID=UPI001CFBFE03|nr:hypothetical protein [Bacillus shivajii]UCZ54316.1 hypothetical protein LGQ02_06010 [Bacillus shivajii]